MNIVFSKNFIKTAKKLPLFMKKLLNEKITEVEQAETIAQITQIKKLQGFTDVYRIRITNYRIFLIFTIKSDTLYFEYLVKRGDAYHKEYLKNLKKK